MAKKPKKKIPIVPPSAKAPQIILGVAESLKRVTETMNEGRTIILKSKKK